MDVHSPRPVAVGRDHAIAAVIIITKSGITSIFATIAPDGVQHGGE